MSNCQHSDRPLQHIQKKGRPVSQCTHCRTLRKSRSAHVKCDCGEKSHTKGTCSHSKESDSKADICCCSHGGRCACALKKEHLDPVPESDSDEGSGSLSTPPVDIRRPRAHIAQSEGSGLTVFNNGHHKPAQKHNQMAHKCGLPYVVPRANSIHGGMANRSVDNLPHTNTIDALHSESQIKDSIVSAQQEQRKVKSEHNSPLMGVASNLENLNGQLPPLDLTNLDSMDGFTFPVSMDGLPNMTDIDQPIFSAGLSAASIDWSHYDGLEFNENFTTSELGQAPSFSGFDFSSIDQPALTTTSTSGEISEVEDFASFKELGQVHHTMGTLQYGSDFDTSDPGDNEGYRLSTASSYMALPQAQILTNNENETLDIDKFLDGLAASTSNASDGDMQHGLPITSAFDGDMKFMATAPFDDTGFQLAQTDDDDGLWMNNFTSNNISVDPTTSDLSKHHVWGQ